MKGNIIKMICGMGVVCGLWSCKSGDQSFPDYEGGTTVYFAYQYPVRTLVFGDNEEYDQTLDNAHKCKIMATFGGSYNGSNGTVTVAVDESLCDNLYFEDGVTPVKAMPSNYYKLSTTTLNFNGTMNGSTEVTLEDAFFNDPDAVKNTYVIPLRITNVEGADSILKGQDFVLCAVKYVNPWHADYLRHGVDEITTAAEKVTVVRHNQYVENDEVIKLATKAFNQVVMTVNMKDNAGKNVPCQLLLTFDNDNKCTISALTAGFTAQGTGSFVKNGEKNSMGGKDRNALYLNYTLASESLAKSQTTTDTLVVRNRGIKQEYFTVSK